MGQDPKSGKTIAFKPTEEMRAALEEMADKEGISRSELARRSVALYMDLYQKLGAEWHLVTAKAGMQERSLGVTLSVIIKSAMEQERKAKK